jgi:hypothetical protein
MFHKEKLKAYGSFDKDKCRIVLLSNKRDPSKIGETTCPTVNPISVMTQLNLAAVNRDTLISAYDSKGEFLLTPMQKVVRMFIKVSPDVTEYSIRFHPKRAKRLHDDGCLYFELKRYVYGLHETSHEFNGFLDKHPKDIGFKPTKADEYLYTYDTDDRKMILPVHIDDILLSSLNKKQQI